MNATVQTAVGWVRANPRRAALALGLGLLCLAGAGAAGAWLHPRLVTTVVTDSKTAEELKRVTQENLELSEDLARTQNTLMSLRQLKVTQVHRVKAPGGQVVEDIHTEVHSVESTQTQTTETAKVAAGQQVHVDESGMRNTETTTSTVTAPVADARWLFDIGLGVQPFRAAQLVVLVSVQARLVGPLYLGAWVTVPPSDLAGIAAGLEAGFRFQ